MRSGFMSVVLAALLVVPPSPANAQAIPSLGETIEIAIVNVDVVVTDRDGNRVRGLTRDDFEIYESGKLQPLSHFAEYRDDVSSSTTGVDGTAPQSTAPEQRRTVVLFLEDFRLQDFRVEPYIESLMALVRESIRPGDAVSIVTFDTDAKTRLEPTDDIATAEHVLSDYAKKLVGVRLDRTVAVAEDVTAIMEFERQGADMAAGKGLPRPVTSGESIAKNVAVAAAMQADVEMRRRVAAINAVINGLAGVEGKKSVILAADRLGSFVGAEFFYAGAANAAPSESASPWGDPNRGRGMGATVLPPGEADRYDNRKRIRELIANANAANVSLYPIFPAGLDQTPIDPFAPDVTRQVLLNEMGMRQEIAKETGGLTTYGATEIVKLLPQVADDMSNYYSLAYRARTHRVDEARDLVVKTKNRRLEVRARTQFVEKSDESRMKDRVLAAMYGMSGESPIAVAATIGEAKANGRRQKSVPVSVRVPIGALTLVPQGEKEAGAFSVFVMTGAERGAVSEVTRRTQPFEIPAADVERATAGHFTYDLDVVVNNGADHVAIGLLDEVSKSYGVVRLPLPQG